MRQFLTQKKGFTQLNTRKANLTGFTLTEILVVIGVIGILAALGVFIFRSYQSFFVLSGEVRHFVGNLRYAQQLSITEQIDHAVRFNFSENAYQIIRYGEEEEVIIDKYLPSEINLEELNNYVEARFNPYGAAKKSGKVKLVVEGREKIIDIRPSGFIIIIE